MSLFPTYEVRGREQGFRGQCSVGLPQQSLYFLPDPHEHGSLRPTFFVRRRAECWFCQGSRQPVSRERDEANPGSCGLQDGQHGHTPPEVEQSPAIGGNMLMVAGAEAEEVAEFIVSPAEPGG